jgi:cell division septum initiation protein DivIVA
MFELIDQLAHKLAELSQLVLDLRAENQSLRARLIDANHALEEVHGRVDAATARLETLLIKLPADAAMPPE